MKCCICGSKQSIFHLHHGKRCFLCEECFQKMPTCVKESLPTLTGRDLKELSELFQASDDSAVWKKYGKVGISNTHLHIEEFQVAFSEIRDVELTFLQREGCRPERGGFWSSYGDLCLVITFSKFRIMTLMKSARVFLTVRDVYQDFLITKKDQVIFPKEARLLAALVNMAAHLITHDLSGYRPGTGTSGTSGSRQEKTQWKQFHKQSERKGQGKEPNQTRTSDTLGEALKYYGLSIPFTETALKKRRNELIRLCHPDQIIKDSSLNAEDVNRYYDLLKKYAERGSK